jgi:hypothetical protein
MAWRPSLPGRLERGGAKQAPRIYFERSSQRRERNKADVYLGPFGALDAADVQVGGLRKIGLRESSTATNRTHVRRDLSEHVAGIERHIAVGTRAPSRQKALFRSLTLTGQRGRQYAR